MQNRLDIGKCIKTHLWMVRLLHLYQQHVTTSPRDTGEHATVFQAEITAINMDALDLLEVEMANHTIHFNIDSQGAMKALEVFFTNHKCVAECRRLLNKLTEYNNKVYLNWIPGQFM